MQPLQIDIPDDVISDFCRKRGIREFAIFGSATRPDFSENSDIDVLVSFSDDIHPTMFDIVDMVEELENILGRKVDLLTRKSVENSANYIRSKDILDSAQVIYATK